MTHPQNEPYAVAINIKELKTSGRRAEIARRLLAGSTKHEIVEFLTDTFDMKLPQAISEYRQGLSMIYLQTEATKDDIRKTNLARLEQLWMQAEEDNQLIGKAYYSTQLKNIDMVNKTCGIYEQEEKPVVAIDNDFTVSFGQNIDQNSKQ